MEKRTKFIRLMEPEEAKKVLKEEGQPIPEDIDKIGGRIFKVFKTNRGTVTIYAYGEYREIDGLLINEVIDYDRDEVLFALRTLKRVCRCHTSPCGACEEECPFYFYKGSGDDCCYLSEAPEEWEIVDEEIWRPVR